MRKIIPLSITLCFLFIGTTYSQGLLDSLDNLGNQNNQTNYVEATFKAPRVINGHSVELIGNKDLAFIVSHRFGPISSGGYNFFGLTQSTVRLGLDYGLSKRVNLGFGVGSYDLLFEGFLKYKVLAQSSDRKRSPVTLVYTVITYLSAKKWDETKGDNLFSNRLFYSHQLQIARKFGNKLSLQLTPAIVHRNLVTYKKDQNTVYSVGLGGRYKLSNRFALNAEYFYLLPGQTADDHENTLSLGFDIETGGHVFQLLLSNSALPQDKGFVPETTEKWTTGDIHFGFNIVRVFGLAKYK